MDKLMVIQKLFAAYPNTTASAATHAVYLEVFEEVPVEELHAVVMQCVREGGGFPPSAGQVFERWRTMHSAVTPDHAAEGWLSVQKAMHDPNTYSPDPEGPPPKFKDPLVQRAVAALGWHALRMSENQMADRAQFLKLYEAFARNAAAEERLSKEYKALRASRQLERKEQDVDTPDCIQAPQGQRIGSNGLIKRISG